MLFTKEHCQYDEQLKFTVYPRKRVYCKHDRISGKVVQGASSGPEPYLTVTEEIELVQFLTKCASMGFTRSKKQIFDIVDTDHEGIRIKGEECKSVHV